MAWPALMALVILGLTLLPTSAQHPPVSPWCLICGEEGGSDILRNVALFIPFGMLSARAGARGWQLALVAAAGPLLIEVVQHNWIRGRDGTLSDIVTNAAGFGLGAAAWRSRRLLVGPEPPLAQRLLAVAVAIVCLVFVVTAAAQQPTSPILPVYARWTPTQISGLRFRGELLHADLGGVFLDNGQVRDGPGLARAMAATPSTATVAFTPPRATPGHVNLFRSRSRRGVVLEVFQTRSHMGCVRGLYAARWSFRSPAVSVPLPADRSSRERWTLRCTLAKGTLQVALLADDVREASVPLTATGGWRLWLPTTGLDRSAPLFAFGWTAALLLPLGLLARRSASTRLGVLRAASVAVLAPLGTAALLSTMLYVSLPMTLEAFGAVAGVALGAALADPLSRALGLR